MANEFYTLIVVPHAKARFRRFQVPLTHQVGTGQHGRATLLVGGLMSTSPAWRPRSTSCGPRTRCWPSRTRSTSRTPRSSQAKVGDLQSIVTKLGVMAGLEQALPDPKVGGVGGLSEPRDFARHLDPRPSTPCDDDIRPAGRKLHAPRGVLQGPEGSPLLDPSVWPVRGYLSAAFGNRVDPFTGQPDFHPGSTSRRPSAPRSRPPPTVWSSSCGAKGGYGNAIVIDHGYGVVTRYAHLSGSTSSRASG